jgi:hypothetical protein
MWRGIAAGCGLAAGWLLRRKRKRYYARTIREKTKTSSKVARAAVRS